MKTILKTTKILNVIALLFLILGAYGIAITGILQVFAAIIYLFAFPKSRLIYFYFGMVALFFLLWDQDRFNWLFVIPFFLILYLSYIIHLQKNKL